MNSIADKLIKAQKYADLICPTIGGFPLLAEILRQAGVQSNRWYLPSCQSIYLMKNGAVVQQRAPLITETSEVPRFNCNALISAIKADQQGKGSFSEFLLVAWNAGVIEYNVDFLTREVIYYGINSEQYSEKYSAIHFKAVESLHA